MLSLLVLVGGCREGGERGTTSPANASGPPMGPFSADAQPEIAESLRLDLESPRHASDGGGRAFIGSAFSIEPGREPVAAPRNAAGEPIFAASSQARLHVVYESGPLGVAV